MPDILTAEAMLARLVGFNTESQRSNLGLVAFVEDYLAGHGVTSRRVPDETGQKASLYAQIGPDVPGGVILSGHTDVVPVEGQDWTSDPYAMTERDGRLYGRGTCDMKGFLAAALSAVPRMKAASLARPIQLALSYDEEPGCFAAPALAAEMRDRLPRAALAIIGEPTMMKVVTSHKAIAEFETHVRGYEVHSSRLPYGVPAIHVAARLIGWLDAQNAANRTRAEGSASPFDPPWTTLHAGTIRGGTVHNITARDCVFATDIRCLPEEDIDAWVDRYRAEAARIEAEIKAIHPDAAITVDIVSTVPGCRPETDGAAEALARALTGDNGNHVVSYATEAGQFQDAGFSAVVCGPGSIDQAHKPDEYLSREQLAQAERFMDRLVAHLG